jgi:hypothetical protein
VNDGIFTFRQAAALYLLCLDHRPSRSLSLDLSIVWRGTTRPPLPRAAAHCVLALAILLIALNLVTFVWLPRYDPVGGQLLVDPGFATLGESRSAWQPVGNSDPPEPVSGGVRLTNDDGQRAVLIEQIVALPAGVEGLRLAATIELDAVARGPERWQKARLFVLGVKPDGRSDYSRSHRFLHATGTTLPRRWSDVFMLEPARDRARVLIGLPRATGKMVVTDIELQGVALKPAFRLMRTITLAGWVAGALVLAGILWRRSRNRLAATLALGSLAAVIAITAIPYDVRAPVQALFGELGGKGDVGLFKLAMHVGVLALLAIAAGRLLPTLQWSRLWCALVVAGLALELGEWFRGTLDRGDAVDFAANVAGTTLGLSLAFLGERWPARRQRSRRSSGDAAHLSG